MKTKEHSTEVRDKVIQMHRLGKGYKIISKCLDIPVSTVGSIIRKWKLHHTTQALPRKGRPSKLSAQTRRRLVREATESHREANNHFEGATEFSGWEWSNGAPVNHIKSSA